MDDFLSKPVGIEELGTMITKWLPHPEPSHMMDHPITEKTRKESTTLPPCLDETILENLKTLGGEDDPEFFITVIDQFLSDLPRHLEGIKQAVEIHDSEALVETAHACKGSSRSIGAILLAETSYTLELMGLIVISAAGQLDDVDGIAVALLPEPARSWMLLAAVTSIAILRSARSGRESPRPDRGDR